MTTLKLAASIAITSPYKGTTKFEFWKNLREGDIIKVYMELTPTGSNRGKIYAPMIKAKHNDRVFSDTINSFQKYLSKIGYEELTLPNDVIHKVFELADEIGQDNFLAGMSVFAHGLAEIGAESLDKLKANEQHPSESHSKPSQHDLD